MAVIGIMDSGMGGLSVLKEVRELLPCEHYIYYADTANCPYGEKNDEFIRARSHEIVSELAEKGAQIVIIACNTATAAAIESLRESFDFPIIGIEPAVKPAALSSKSGVVGVLATASTLNAEKYQHTRDSFASRAKFIEKVGQGFVELVESGELDGERAEKIVSESLVPLLEAGADTIVLGCTHYPFLLPLMQKIAGDGISFINPAPAVAKHLLDVLQASSIPYGQGEGQVEMLSSE